jgi:hypothetical protein
MHEGYINGYVNGAFNSFGCNKPPSKRLRKLLNEPDIDYALLASGEIPEEMQFIQTSLGHKIKHARVSPSISQQVKIGNLSSTLRPNQ